MRACRSVDVNYSLKREDTKVQKETIYQNPDCIISEIVKINNRKYMRGKIVGFIDNDHYKVLLEDGEIGKIECGKMDLLEKVIDYKDKTFHTFNFGEAENLEKLFLKHINRNYIFEIIGTAENKCILNIENVKIDYLDYAIENQCILKGRIIQIEKGHVSIEVPFGYVFFINISYVFGYRYASTFDYMYYVGAEISVIIRYDENANKIYPEIANRNYNVLESELNYIFPVLSIGGKTKGRFSKLWLDKQLYIDNDGRFPKKEVGQLVVASGIQEKGTKNVKYIGKIKKIYSNKDAPQYRDHILSVGWVKNLCGYDIKAAINYLEKKKFPYIIEYLFNSDENRGAVLAMQPAIKEETIIPRNVIIKLIVNKGMHREYVIPDFTGIYIKDVRAILKENKIESNNEVSNSKVDGIGNNCVIQIRPSAGNKLLSGEHIIVTIYQDRNYESPFALRESEYLKDDNIEKVVASDAVIDNFCSEPWGKEILTFILKHKIVTSSHLKLWIYLNFAIENLDDIDNSLKYLRTRSMVGSMCLASDVSETCLHFFFPHKRLYSASKGFAGYNGFFSFYGKDPLYCKIRSAENQAFLGLYRILKEDNLIFYEVDCMQAFMYENKQELLRVHIAVNATNNLKQQTDIYFIEAFRFLNEEQLLEGWGKLLRYNMYISREYQITPYLLLAFEDEMHYKKFMLKKPNGFRSPYIKIYYTWDSLTNNNYDKFDDIFTKVNDLC